MSEKNQSTKLVKPLRSGQITIPVEFRKRLGITDESVLEMRVSEGELRVRVLKLQRPNAGSPWLRDLYAMFASVRDEIAERGERDDEINAMIDAAVKAARDEHA
ncbi:MAG TPA: AbrB/MazE/SpoVT family DNA-binding domain-containing protein [Nitrolancea sp.]|nr:AbrB/MazE/SpoVT family DNA-binding domain-containing protein [Nitrolancea sp.]